MEHLGERFSTGSNITSFSQFIMTNETVLPVELLDFKAILNNKKVDLSWSIADEKDVNHYIIERSFDGKTFDFLNKTPKGTFSTTDETPQYGVNYYRLKMVENDGKSSFSPIRTVIFESDKKAEFKIYPNPTNDILNIQFETYKEQSAEIELFDNLGRMVHFYRFNTRLGNNQLLLNAKRFVAGQYILKIKQGNNIITQQVVFQ
jgi:Secretion system C-terminal sorting domain